MLRALDHLHGRQVALKVRPAPTGSSRAQLLSEARLLLSLSPHAGPAARARGLLRRRRVRHRDGLDRGHRPRGVARGTGHTRARTLRPSIDYLEQAAEALDHLHGHDPPVVHGDVKPANLILTSPAESSSSTSGSPRPATGFRRAGTPGFVAPEVAAGEPPTRASDIYSLAMTAFTLLTGSPPRGGAPEWPSGLDAERRRVFEMRSGSALQPIPRDVPPRPASWSSAFAPAGKPISRRASSRSCMTDIEGSTVFGRPIRTR